MDRFVNQDGMDFQQGTVGVDLEFTATTAGAVPSTLTRSAGILSVTKSTNDYVVVFQDGYIAYLGGYGNVVQASVSASAATSVKVTDFTNANADGLAEVTLSPLKGSDGTAVALAVDDILQFHFRMTRLLQPNE
jgi:hypothetical protein